MLKHTEPYSLLLVVFSDTKTRVLFIVALKQSAPNFPSECTSTEHSLQKQLCRHTPTMLALVRQHTADALVSENHVIYPQHLHTRIALNKPHRWEPPTGEKKPWSVRGGWSWRPLQGKPRGCSGRRHLARRGPKGRAESSSGEGWEGRVGRHPRTSSARQQRWHLRRPRASSAIQRGVAGVSAAQAGGGGGGDDVGGAGVGGLA